MSLNLEKIVPWGRSYTEYLRMFSLGPADLQKNILGCGDGPAGFNAGMRRQGGRVTSVDPIYRFSAAEIAGRITETSAVILQQLEACLDDYVWDLIKTPEELEKIRMEAMDTFLADYPDGRCKGRYVVGELPALPFTDRQFDLVLCSHLLFLYSEQLSLEFHLAAVTELCRVAEEIRIFPLLSLTGDRSPHLNQVISQIEAGGGRASVVKVPYEFQRGANEMLVIHGNASFGNHRHRL